MCFHFILSIDGKFYYTLGDRAMLSSGIIRGSCLVPRAEGNGCGEHLTTLNKPRRPSLRWHLYILKCSDNTFYTGVTNNLERRLGMHNDGRASRYTRSRLPVILIYQERCRNKSSALKKECRIKSLSRKEKEQYVHKKSRTPDSGSSPE